MPHYCSYHTWCVCVCISCVLHVFPGTSFACHSSCFEDWRPGFHLWAMPAQGRKLTFVQSCQLATNEQLLGATLQKLVVKSWSVKYFLLLVWNFKAVFGWDCRNYPCIAFVFYWFTLWLVERGIFESFWLKISAHLWHLEPKTTVLQSIWSKLQGSRQYFDLIGQAPWTRDFIGQMIRVKTKYCVSRLR